MVFAAPITLLMLGFLRQPRLVKPGEKKARIVIDRAYSKP
jgi:hypothetical protein